VAIARSPRIDPGAALEHHRDERAGGDELDELAEERLVEVLGVVTLRQLAGHRQHAQRDGHESLALEPHEDLAAQSARIGIGLGEDERALHRDGLLGVVSR
jgi:hypothetical protein